MQNLKTVLSRAFPQATSNWRLLLFFHRWVFVGFLRPWQMRILLLLFFLIVDVCTVPSLFPPFAFYTHAERTLRARDSPKKANWQVLYLKLLTRVGYRILSIYVWNIFFRQIAKSLFSSEFRCPLSALLDFFFANSSGTFEQHWHTHTQALFETSALPILTYGKEVQHVANPPSPPSPCPVTLCVCHTTLPLVFRGMKCAPKISPAASGGEF